MYLIHASVAPHNTAVDTMRTTPTTLRPCPAEPSSAEDISSVKNKQNKSFQMKVQ